MARRAASICRLLIQHASIAWRPKSPNATVAPRVAIPVRRPRCILRYLTRLGISIQLLDFLVVGVFLAAAGLATAGFFVVALAVAVAVSALTLGAAFGAAAVRGRRGAGLVAGSAVWTATSATGSGTASTISGCGAMASAMDTVSSVSAGSPRCAGVIWTL